MFKQKQFYLNGLVWKIRVVNHRSSMLMDRTGTRTVATTDPTTRTVYLSSDLHDGMLVKVLIHELGHCAMISFNLIEDIHRMVKPEYWLEAEEWLCNFLSDYGLKIFSIAYSILGEEAFDYVLYRFERMIA